MWQDIVCLEKWALYYVIIHAHLQFNLPVCVVVSMKSVVVDDNTVTVCLDTVVGSTISNRR